MKKILTLSACLFFVVKLSSQNKKVNTSSNTFFDEKLAVEQAISKGIKSSEIKGYVQFLKNDFSSKKALEQQSHKHTPYNNNSGIQETVIYLEPNKPMSFGCPNMGFEQYSFNGWNGDKGTTSTGPSGGNPNYTSTGSSIVNPAGNNVSLINTSNYHTLMTVPPVDPNIISLNGYDSLTLKTVSTQTISEVPFVSPFSFDGVSARMNGAVAGNRACRLKYVTTASSGNQQLSFSYAFVLQNPASHAANESPYFKVEIKDETTGLLLPGCSSYSFNTQSITPADSLKQSVIADFDPIFYRKWQKYSFDLSSLPPGTNVSVTFEVGGCTPGGHWAYAYVDAECSGAPLAYANMCSGSPFATLVAQPDFAAYQWFGPLGLIAGATNDTLIENTPIAGTTYTVNMVAPGGCVTTKTITLNNSVVQITNLNSSSSCIGGNSGSATAQVNGSSGAYTYTWTNTVTNTIVSNSQTATNLAPGTYSVLVSSSTCGSATGNITVGVTPAFLTNQIKLYCGNSTYIAQPGGSNYVWYQGSTLISGSAATNDTLYINTIFPGDKYTVVYTNSQGCKDSIAYTLNPIPGGNITISNIVNVCPNNTNGSALVTLQTFNTAPYTYTVKDVSGTILNSTTSSTLFPITNLAAGTYTSIATDGNCIYSNIFTISAIQTNFTITPSVNNFCSPTDTALINFNFGNSVSANCTLSSNGSCTSPNTIQIGVGTASNTPTSFPTIYSNWYKNARHQILYTASELLAGGLLPGKISSLAFNILAIAGTTVYPDFTIKMKCTSQQDLTSAAFDNNGLTQVYYSTSQTIATGWNVYNFPTAYEWDGVSNILLDVCTSLTSMYSYNSSMLYTTTPFVSVRWLTNDAYPACMTTSASTGYAPNNTFRPNIQFENCGSASSSSYSISVSSNGIITHNYNNDSIKVVPTSIPTSDIVYTLTVTNPQGGCTASQTFTMAANIAAVSTVTNASCGTCPNGAIQVVPSCGIGPYNFLWTPGGQTTAYISSLLPGCYTVTITDADANITTEDICVTFVTQLDESSIISGLSVFPNPSNGQFNLLSEIVLDKIDITVFNTLGQTIIQETIKNTKQATIDISKLSKGIYYLKASNDNASKLFKLILE